MVIAISASVVIYIGLLWHQSPSSHLKHSWSDLECHPSHYTTPHPSTPQHIMKFIIGAGAVCLALLNLGVGARPLEDRAPRSSQPLNAAGSQAHGVDPIASGLSNAPQVQEGNGAILPERRDKGYAQPGLPNPIWNDPNHPGKRSPQAGAPSAGGLLDPNDLLQTLEGEISDVQGTIGAILPRDKGSAQPGAPNNVWTDPGHHRRDKGSAGQGGSPNPVWTDPNHPDKRSPQAGGLDLGGLLDPSQALQAVGEEIPRVEQVMDTILPLKRAKGPA